MKTKVCAKDKKFEEERISFRRQIKELKTELDLSDCVIKNLKKDIVEKDTEISQLKDWIERLLKYMNLKEDDIKAVITKEKQQAELFEKLVPLFGFMGKYL